MAFLLTHLSLPFSVLLYPIHAKFAILGFLGVAKVA
jgi:hypothetical protein